MGRGSCGANRIYIILHNIKDNDHLPKQNKINDNDRIVSICRMESRFIGLVLE